ncbi:unnamed protein product [Sphagnum jensenii]|uniref:Tyrosine specific protein phosphatases domain-containing protein n=1 Tax=Sphagnum jensenii TaxID=128206 RepID=A0ABP1AFK9_9BRYO
MNFNAINVNLIVGSHPRDADDIRLLYNQNGVRAIVNLQRSGEPLRGDIDAITEACALVGNRIWYQRVPIQDASEDSLRDNLPEAVGILNMAIQDRVKEPGDTVYLHCCEGLGRSPSVAVAYLYWFTDMTLNDADALVRGRRHGAGPNLAAIREATNNILGAVVNGNIGADQRAIIQGHVTTLPRVTNA